MDDLTKFENYRKWLAQHDFLGSQEFDYLDSLDLSVIICANVDKTCREIIEIIEDRYEEDYLSKYPNDEMLFNSISESDFVDYIKYRYGISHTETITNYFNL